jgi:hypothetical protein
VTRPIPAPHNPHPDQTWHEIRPTHTASRSATRAAQRTAQARSQARKPGRVTTRRVLAALFSAGLLASIATIAAGYTSGQAGTDGGAVAATLSGPCGKTGPGQEQVEAYLAARTGRFGQVKADARQSAADCAAIAAFQKWAGIPNPTGFADATTGEVARRLAAVQTGDCAPQPRGTTVCVDLTHQAMWVVRSGRIVLGPTVARTGRPGKATPIGIYEITEKKVDTISSETGTRLPYWQRFFRDFGFHAADTPMYAAIPGSLGCVNLLNRDAQALFKLTELGTEVHLFGQKPGT